MNPSDTNAGRDVDDAGETLPTLSSWAVGEAMTAANLKALVNELNQRDLLERIASGEDLARQRTVKAKGEA